MQRVDKERVSIIYKRDLKEYVSWKVYKLLLLIFILFPVIMVGKSVISYTDGASFALNIYNSLFLLSLIPAIITLPVFITTTITRDKANKLIVSLLSTPLNVRELIKGKTKAVCFLGLFSSILGSLFFVVALNVVVFILKGKFVYFSTQLLISTFMISPIFSYGLSKLTIQLALIKSPELATSPPYIIGFAVLIGIPILSSFNYISYTSWSFILEYLLVTSILIILTEAVGLNFTKEKIIKFN